MTIREEVQERIAKMDDAALSLLIKQIDVLERDEAIGLTPELADMASDIKAQNKDKDPAALQRKIDEAVDAVRYR